VYRSVGGVLVGSARRDAQAIQQKKARAALGAKLRANGKLPLKVRRGAKPQGKSR
jgi:hypothetical protein